MAKMVNDMKFSWGDVVSIEKYSVNDEDLSGLVGTVCGVTSVNNQFLADTYQVAIGEYIYTVELSDGRSYGLPTFALEFAS